MSTVPAAFPAEQADREVDPQSDLGYLLFDPSPEATQAWIEAFLTIPTERGEIVDFNLFPQQVLMLQEHTGRDVTIKGRQTRASSLILARNLRRMTNGTGTSLTALVMTQDDATTQTFRTKIKHFLYALRDKGLDYPILLDNREELVIGKEMQNRFIFASAEERVAGRAFSAQIVHLSETAHYKPENVSQLVGGITPAVPGPPHGWFDMESTPNGAQGLFYEYAMDAKLDDPLQGWKLHFYPWWLEPRYRAGTEDDCDLQLDSYTLEELESTFSPTKHEERLMSECGLSLRQMLWRRWRERELNRTGVPFAQEYVEDLASCFLTTAENYFASPDGVDHLSHYRAMVREPVERKQELPYRQSTMRFYGSNLHIWEYPDPKALYVGFVDCAEGGTSRDHDYSAMTIINCATKHHVATLRLKTAPAEFGALCCAVGQYYNWAIIGGERDARGLSALARIRDLNYPKLYYHMDYTVAKSNKDAELWIFPTEPHRNEILRALRESVFDHSFVTPDAAAVSEMGTFDWQKVTGGRSGVKARARKRKHDDLVISLSGSVYVAGRVLRTHRPREEPESTQELVVGAGGLVLSRGNTSTVKPWFR